MGHFYLDIWFNVHFHVGSSPRGRCMLSLSQGVLEEHSPPCVLPPPGWIHSDSWCGWIFTSSHSCDSSSCLLASPSANNWCNIKSESMTNSLSLCVCVCMCAYVHVHMCPCSQALVPNDTYRSLVLCGRHSVLVHC